VSYVFFNKPRRVEICGVNPHYSSHEVPWVIGDKQQVRTALTLHPLPAASSNSLEYSLAIFPGSPFHLVKEIMHKAQCLDQLYLTQNISLPDLDSCDGK